MLREVVNGVPAAARTFCLRIPASVWLKIGVRAYPCAFGGKVAQALRALVARLTPRVSVMSFLTAGGTRCPRIFKCIDSTRRLHLVGTMMQRLRTFTTVNRKLKLAGVLWLVFVIFPAALVDLAEHVHGDQARLVSRWFGVGAAR